MKALFTYSKVFPSEPDVYYPEIENGFLPYYFDSDDGDTLRDVIKVAQDLDINSCEGACWFYTADPHVDYAEGTSTEYCLHIDDVTPETWNRIARIICGEVTV